MQSSEPEAIPHVRDNAQLSYVGGQQQGQLRLQSLSPSDSFSAAPRTSATSPVEDDSKIGPAPLVRIYAQLSVPEDGEPESAENSEHDGLDDIAWTWHCVLEVPVSTLLRIDETAPWRWLLFACGTIFGTTKGRLYTSQDAIGKSDTSLDLDRAPPQSTCSEDLYFFIAEQDRAAIFPTEADLCPSRTGTMTAMEERQRELREMVVERDRKCVVTGVASDFCRSCHLIPHAKGDTYIKKLTQARAHDGVEVISDIDDLRNVILLNPTYHIAFGKDLGIMKKPNFAYPGPGEADSWTLHVINNLRLPSTVVRHDQAVTVPADKTVWPPSLLFDQVYAAAVLTHYGRMNGTFKRMAHGVYYDEGVEPLNSSERKQERMKQQLKMHGDRVAAQTDERGENWALKHDRHNEIDDDEMPQLALWTSLLAPDTRRWFGNKLMRASRKKAAAVSVDRVEAWRKKVEL